MSSSRILLAILALVEAGLLGAQTSASTEALARPGAPLIGEWALDRQRTHYGPSAERRRWERFTCRPQGDRGVTCRIDAEREDGRRTAASFTVAGESASPVVGMPDVDAVRLHTVDPTIADATFYFRATPVFGYRAYLSANRRSLTIVALDPVTRAALTSVVVYDRQ